MNVLGVRRSPEPVPGVDRQGTTDDLAAFLPEADFVVLAVPISDDTEGLIDEAAFARMKSTATLVNVGRGAVVDTDALRAALASGGIAQAFLDVLPVEPWPSDDGPVGHTQCLHRPAQRVALPDVSPSGWGRCGSRTSERYVKGEPFLYRGVLSRRPNVAIRAASHGRRHPPAFRVGRMASVAGNPRSPVPGN